MSARRLGVGAAATVVVVLVVALSTLAAIAGWHPWTSSPAPVASRPEDVAPSPPEPSPASPLVDRTPEIRGRVLDADGDPVDAATVRLMSTSPPYSVSREVKTAATGAFSFANVAPGSARVVADHGVDGIVTSGVLRAEAGQTVELTLVLSPASQVRGIVVDAQAHPVAGAIVSVEALPWSISASSDGAGAFDLVAVPDEATSLVAVARGYRTAHASLASATTTVSEAGDHTERIVRIVLGAASPVDGEVHDEDGNPVSADVVACEGAPSETRAQSAADGTFHLAPSAIGCDAVAENAEFAPSAAVPVIEGKPLALQVKAGGAIEGVVVDERGSGVTPVTLGIESFVPARGKVHPAPGPRSFDDLRGAFHWEKLAPGSYVLTASTPGRPPARSASIDVRGGAISRDVRIVLAPGGVLTGHVYGPDGPVAGAHLRFDSVSSVVESKASASTDDRGEYRLEEAPEGPLTLRVEKDGLRTKLVSGLSVAAGATLREDVTLSAREGNTGLELGGIGAALAPGPGGFTVQKVFPGDPAAIAGLREGDRILRVDGESVEGMSMADILVRVRGEPGTTVGVAVQRADTGAIVEVVLVRARVVH